MGSRGNRWKPSCNSPLNPPKRQFHSTNAGPLRQRYATNPCSISDRPPHGERDSSPRGWHELENGDLLKAAEAAGFDVLVTADKNLSYQQNLSGRRIAIVVLGKGRWSLIRPHVSEVVAAVNAATPGSFVEVEIPFA